MAVCPLRPATDLRLGAPLPHQLANQPRAPSSAIFTFLLSDLCGISFGFPKLFPTKEWIPTCYSPVRHFTHGLLHFLVRLACVKRAANVDSEPGSNSQFNCLSLSIWSGNLQISFPYLAELKVRRNCFASNQIVKHLCSPTGILRIQLTTASKLLSLATRLPDALGSHHQPLARETRRLPNIFIGDLNSSVGTTPEITERG